MVAILVTKTPGDQVWPRTQLSNCLVPHRAMVLGAMVPHSRHVKMTCVPEAEEASVPPEHRSFRAAEVMSPLKFFFFLDFIFRIRGKKKKLGGKAF